MERPDDDGAMFFRGMKFAPDASLSQNDLNKIVVNMLSVMFIGPDGEPMPVKHTKNPMLSLVQFIVDLDIRLDEETFEKMPDDIKKYFLVINRDGQDYRYGTRPL